MCQLFSVRGRWGIVGRSRSGKKIARRVYQRATVRCISQQQAPRGARGGKLRAASKRWRANRDTRPNLRTQSLTAFEILQHAVEQESGCFRIVGPFQLFAAFAKVFEHVLEPKQLGIALRHDCPPAVHREAAENMRATVVPRAGLNLRLSWFVDSVAESQRAVVAAAAVTSVVDVTFASPCKITLRSSCNTRQRRECSNKPKAERSCR